MNVAKYVVFDCDGVESVVLFPDCLTHNEVFVNSRMTGLCTPVAAGEFTIEHNQQVVVEGESKSLKIGIRPQDALLIRKLLFPPKTI